MKNDEASLSRRDLIAKAGLGAVAAAATTVLAAPAKEIGRAHV